MNEFMLLDYTSSQLFTIIGHKTDFVDLHTHSYYPAIKRHPEARKEVDLGSCVADS
jgi:hypothetical protein